MSAPTMTVSERDRVLAKGISVIGTAEVPPFSNRQPFGEWYGLNGYAWCAMFVSWCFYKILGWAICPADTKKGYASCLDGYNWFKRRGAIKNRNARMQPGCIVFFTFSHTGILVENLPDGRIRTLEGNTNGDGGRDGGVVMFHNRSRSLVKGFGEIIFVEDRVPTHVEAPPVQPERKIPAFAGKTLEEGMTGEEVLKLKFLMVLGGYGAYFSMRGDDAETFGPGTEAAVKKIQETRNYLVSIGPDKNKLKPWRVDGKVGNQTWNFLGWWIKYNKF